ncbi:hypothetical protein NECAME_01796 [Necator americanus]|uniref:Uncharacterized protein n=1 Tax=Necator americanus TaxID=51031 RepID=W2TP71_NECAM|nr:hypothetical protein NECAME_01796 [Necator americanus]ETN83489.1 hypothetical protein NECAME_01796 [Necator americanus]
MRHMQLLILIFAIFTIVAAVPLNNARVKRQWGGPWGGYGMNGMGGMGGGYGMNYPGYGGGWGWRPRPYVQRTVVVHHYHPWRS